jgi:hypothetical protein
MPSLQPAGFLGRVFSSLFPKRLEAQVCSEDLADGRIALHLVYLLSGHEVDPALVKPVSRQRILGYSVVTDRSVLSLSRHGAMRLTKQKAAEVLDDLRRKGIAVRDKTRATLTDRKQVRVKLALAMHPGDVLDVQSQLITDDGVVVAKPLDLEQLRRDEGWYVAEGHLLHVNATGSHWDDILITAQADSHLTGVAVPEFLKAIEAFGDELKSIEKNDALRELAVYGEKHENRVTVDGDSDSIQVSPQLVYYG